MNYRIRKIFRKTYGGLKRLVQQSTEIAFAITDKPVGSASVKSDPIIDESVQIPGGHQIETLDSQAPNESIRSLSMRSDNEKADVEFTDGPARVVTAFDGTKNCHAILMTETMIDDLKQILEATHKVKRKEEVQEDAKNESDRAELSISNLQKLMYESKREEEKNAIKKAIEQHEQIRMANLDRQYRIDGDLVVDRFSLEFLQSTFEKTFQDALENANLFVAPDFEKADGAIRHDVALIPQYSLAAKSDVSDPTQISLEELYRRTVVEDVERTRNVLERAQDLFDDRQNEYAEQLSQYYQARREGACEITRTDFDCCAIEAVGEMTRDLSVAEAAHQSALRHAKALGLIDFNFDQESNFADDPNDGYRESLEAPVMAPANHVFIESWVNGVLQGDEYEHTELEQLEQWDVKSVGLSDSVSVVDYTRNRRRIDRWRRICEEVSF